jgi:riboflavin transporter FmnP
MRRDLLGYVLPLFFTAVIMIVSLVGIKSNPIRWGVVTGIIIALMQSSASVFTMNWAWEKPFFYWVWGGGMFCRLLVFAATAFVTVSFTSFNLAATLITLVCATMFFLVIESSILFWRRK